ncbi:MAG TPA: zf-HC2 domain-containing protein [Acidimicrobiales bacterium]|nr:zf-HC2 domain-containing protein [Acidimicrobiales bacterium]
MTPVEPPEAQPPEAQTPEAQTPEAQPPEAQTPDQPPDAQTPDQPPEAQPPEHPAPEHPAPEHAGDALSALLDGELSMQEEADVQTHLVTCLVCRLEMEAIGATRLRVRALPPVEPPFGLFERMLQPYRPGRRRVAMAFAGAAAAVAAVIVSVAPAREPLVNPSVATLIEAHATSAPDGDPLTNLAPAGVPVSLSR